MGRAVRMYGQNEVFFVTARTVQARYLLRPSAELNEVIGGVLARGLHLFDVELYAFVFASNHVHLLVRARDGVLSRFMQHLLSNVARKVSPLVGWSGPFWDGPFAAAPVLDDSAMIERLRYIVAHGVKEGLVRRVPAWPGLSCVGALLGTAARAFPWFHWKRRWSNGKLREGGERRYAADWVEEFPLEVAVLPPWRELAEEQRQAAMTQMIAGIEDEFREVHPTPLGPEAVKAQDPHGRPAAPKRSRRPICHTSSQELKALFRDLYSEFRRVYAEASQRFRDGDLFAVFPAGSLRPPGYMVRRESMPALDCAAA